MAIFSTCSMLIVYACTSISFLSFKTRFVCPSPVIISKLTCDRTINGGPDEDVFVSTPEGHFLNRNATDYPYKSHLQWLRSAYALFGCLLLIFFNGWRSILKPFSHADFLAAYLSIPIFFIIVIIYHLKDEVDWRPWRWGRRLTMDIASPIVTREKDPEKRKGRLHRRDRRKFWVRENARAVGEFVWTWLK